MGYNNYYHHYYYCYYQWQFIHQLITQSIVNTKHFLTMKIITIDISYVIDKHYLNGFKIHVQICLK